MLFWNSLIVLCCLILSVGALAQTPTAEPTAREVASGFAANRSTVQQNAFWASVKGKQVRWTIKITDVVPGWLSGYYVRGNALPNLGVSCELDDGPTNKALVQRLNVGDRVVCAGRLDDPTMTLFGVIAVTIKNGVISSL